MTRMLVLIGLVAALGMLGGCGGPAGKSISGNVSFDGAPVEEGEIIFRPEDSKEPVVATKIVNGQYSAVCPPGRRTVEIRALRATDKPDGVGGFLTEPYIPAKYNDQTTLEANVDLSGPATFDFDLTSK